MATEALKVDTQDSIETLQREAEELKKRLEEEKAKLKDVESNLYNLFFLELYDFETFRPQDVSAPNYPRRFGPGRFGHLPNRPQNKYCILNRYINSISIKKKINLYLYIYLIILYKN
jgi:hypothetical protein